MKLKVQFDPMRKFEHVNPVQLINACGYLLPWAMDKNALSMNTTDMFNHFYKYGIFEIKNPNIDYKTGLWKYPGDPDMYPMIKLYRNDEVIYFYQYALICWFDKDQKCFATRMD